MLLQAAGGLAQGNVRRHDSGCHMIKDPVGLVGLGAYARRLRQGETTVEATVDAYLQRIAALDPRLGSYQHVNENGARKAARAMDELLGAGVDLGPLMGVPVAVKDVFAIDGLPPPRAGSRLEVAHLAGAEGSFIKALKRSGAVILGTTKTVELCLGITGVSTALGTPWNPWDLQHQRIPGGSSSGSAVACAAGLCALAIGTDSGGSVRAPAAFNGIVGFKTTCGRWPTEGAVPLDPEVDSIGLLAHSASDVRIAFRALEELLFGHTDMTAASSVQLDGLRVGVSRRYFEADLSGAVRHALSEADEALRSAGCRLVDFELTEASERTDYFPVAFPTILLANIGRDAFEAGRTQMDQTVADRVATAYEIRASDYARVRMRRLRSVQEARRYFDEIDLIASATVASMAPLLEEFADPQRAMALALGMTHNTQPANYLELCGVSLPIPRVSGQLPVGYQLLSGGMKDELLIDAAVAVESVLGRGASPNLSALWQLAAAA